MSDFNIGDVVYYISHFSKQITKEIITRKDLIDGVPRYWLNNNFGYFHGCTFFKTQEEAEILLSQWNEYLLKEASNNLLEMNEKINDNKDITENRCINCGQNHGSWHGRTIHCR